MTWIERYGAVEPTPEPGWLIVYERYDPATDQIAAVYQKEDVFKAIVYHRQSGSPQWICDFWLQRTHESLLDERQRAIDFVESEIKHSGPCSAPVPNADSNLTPYKPW